MMQVLKKENLIVNSKAMRKAVLFILSILSTLNAWAQEAEPVKKTFWDDPASDPMLPVYLVMAFVFVVIILVGFVAIYLIRILNMLTEEAEKENAERRGVSYEPKISWWAGFIQKVNAAVPVEQEKSIDLGHNYDGIKELDNHLPPWWTWLFIGTIVWAAVYIFVYHFSDTLPLQEEEYQHELAVAAEQSRRLKASQPQAEVDEAGLVYTNDAAIIEKGKAVYMSNSCGSCHRNDGGGNAIGPNLTDEFWLHGGDVKHIFQTIKNGVVEKGMPAWGKTMSPLNVKELTFFVMSLQGTNPVDAKAPQGELFKAVPVESDSTAKEQAAL